MAKGWTLPFNELFCSIALSQKYERDSQNSISWPVKIIALKSAAAQSTVIPHSA